MIEYTVEEYEAFFKDLVVRRIAFSNLTIAESSVSSVDLENLKAVSHSVSFFATQDRPKWWEDFPGNVRVKVN